MTVCVDASVVAKLVIREVDQEPAFALMLQADEVAAPLLVMAEVSSAVYKRVQQGSMPVADARVALADLDLLPIVRQSPAGLNARALEIAMQFRMKWIYDALYVALAEKIGCDLWTADGRLYEAVRDVYPNVRLLSDFKAATP